MLKIFAAASFAALFVAASPLAAAAQTVAPGVHPHHAQQYRGSHRSEMRRRGNQSRERARAGAEHARQMRMQ